MILIIEDSGIERRELKEALEKSGRQVLEAINPEEALDTVKSQGENIDLILLDIMMAPGNQFTLKETQGGLRTGEFLIFRLRRYFMNKPIIAITARKDIGELKDMIGDVVDVFIRKPVLEKEVVKVVDTLLGKSQSGDR